MKFHNRKSKISVVDYTMGSGKGADDKSIIDTGSDSHHRIEVSEPRGREHSGPSAPPKEPAVYNIESKEEFFELVKTDIPKGSLIVLDERRAKYPHELEFQIWAANQKLVMV